MVSIVEKRGVFSDDKESISWSRTISNRCRLHSIAISLTLLTFEKVCVVMEREIHEIGAFQPCRPCKQI
jgi:hypothetical protein